MSLCALLMEEVLTPPPPNPPYVRFHSGATVTLTATKKWDGAIQYSSDSSTWTTWDGSTLSGHDIYLRGIGNSVLTDSGYTSAWDITGTDVECIGNIENLLDYQVTQAGGHPTPGNRCCQCLFAENNSLISAFDYLGESLAGTEDCFRWMYWRCHSLKKGGILTPTVLGKNCYFYMYQDCSALTEMPNLPAMTLAEGCYQGMFCDCTALTNIKSLPAMTMAKSCYYGMFRNTGIVTAPALPSTTLAEMCYYSMFSACASLVNPPALPALEPARGCYTSMFASCTALVTPPDLPFETLGDACYFEMFNGCTSLVHAPRIAIVNVPASTINDSPAYSSMFRGCTSLIEVPAFKQLHFRGSELWCVFKDCTSLKFSKTQTAACPNPYRLPASGSGTKVDSWSLFAFDGTSGTYTGDPAINTTYYTNATVIY